LKQSYVNFVYPVYKQDSVDDYKLETETKENNDVSILSSHVKNFISKEICQNFTADMRNYNLLRYYESLKVIGVGSMGSVAEVQTRQKNICGFHKAVAVTNISNNIGKTDIKTQEKQCFQFPIVGSMFRSCILEFDNVFMKNSGCSITLEQN
jgi:hypothetical protein